MFDCNLSWCNRFDCNVDCNLSWCNRFDCNVDCNLSWCNRFDCNLSWCNRFDCNLSWCNRFDCSVFLPCFFTSFFLGIYSSSSSVLDSSGESASPNRKLEIEIAQYASETITPFRLNECLLLTAK